MFEFVSLLLPLSVLMAVPVAYLVARASRARGTSDGTPRCRACGYSTFGLPGGARCPECGKSGAEIAQPASTNKPLLKSEGVVLCCTLAHAPWMLAVVFGAASNHVSLEGVVLGTVLAAMAIALPLGIAVWACLVVARRCAAWLTVGSLCVLAVLPLIANLCFVANLGSLKSHGGMFDGLANALLVWLFAPLMTTAALSLFSVCGIVTAGVLGVQRAVNGDAA